MQLTHCVPPHNSKSSKSTGSFKSSMRRPTIALVAATAAALAPPRLARCTRETPRRHALPTVSTEAQLQMCWRLVVAAASGSALGFERIGRGRATKRDSPVGVRTMALVSMGSACFTCAGFARCALNHRVDGVEVHGIRAQASSCRTATPHVSRQRRRRASASSARASSRLLMAS